MTFSYCSHKSGQIISVLCPYEAIIAWLSPPKSIRFPPEARKESSNCILVYVFRKPQNKTKQPQEIQPRRKIIRTKVYFSVNKVTRIKVTEVKSREYEK